MNVETIRQLILDEINEGGAIYQAIMRRLKRDMNLNRCSLAEGYRPIKDNLDPQNPPQGGSGMPR